MDIVVVIAMLETYSSSLFIYIHNLSLPLSLSPSLFLSFSN